MKLEVGQRIDILEFVYDEQDCINHDIIKTGWQAAGNYDKGTIASLKGHQITCWADEVTKIGTMVIKSLK